jgi:scavenger receptor class B, member 1
LLSFPHFYLADDSIRQGVEGISPPEKEKHQFFIDVQPLMGTTLRAKARVQINLAVSHVDDIKQVASFPDIIFPILWFEEGVNGLPDEVVNLMKLATDIPPKAKSILMIALFTLGGLLLIVSVSCLIRKSNRQNTLHLDGTNYLATQHIDQQKKKAKMDSETKTS